MSSLRRLSSLLAISLVVASCAQPEATKSAAPAPPPPPAESAVTQGPPPPGAVPIATAAASASPQASASAPTLSDETKKPKTDKDVGRVPAATTTAVQKPKCNCTPGDPTCNC